MKKFLSFLRKLGFGGPAKKVLSKKTRLDSNRNSTKFKSKGPKIASKDLFSQNAKKEQIIKGTLYHNTSSVYSINGKDIFRNSGTWVIGDIVKGVPVTISATTLADGRLYAKKITNDQQGEGCIKKVTLKQANEDKILDETWHKEIEEQSQKK